MKFKLVSFIVSFALLISLITPSMTSAREVPIISSTEAISTVSYQKRSNYMIQSLAIWGVVARVVVVGGKNVIQWGTKIFKKAPTSKVTNALSSFQTATYKTGSHTFKLTKTDMKHMLERHHPEYWDGSVKSSQMFYNPNLSVADIKDIAMSIAKQKSSELAKKGTNATFQVEGTVNGVEYVLGITKGHIKQLYPKY